MSTYLYRSSDGATAEAEYPIGTAPQSIRRRGKRFMRVITPPTVRTLSPFERGEKPSISHQLPRWYGYGQRERAWKEHMKRLDLEDTPHRRRQLAQCNMIPDPKLVDRLSREAVHRAGAEKHFTKDGKPIATSRRGHLSVDKHLDSAKKVGDDLGWD